MVERLIEDFEERHARRPSVRMAVGLALREWLAYSVAAVPEPREHLHRANHTVLSILRKNPSDMRLFWLGTFFAIELGHFDKANEMLDNAYAYRSYYRSNQPLNYQLLHFLYAYLEIKQKRAKSARKHMKNLSGKGSVYDLMMGILHLAFYEYEEAYRCLLSSHDGGCRSVFLYNALFNYYRTATRSSISLRESHLLLHTVHWALNHGADVEDIIVVYQDDLLQGGHIELAERIYRQFPNPWILKELCAHYMAIPDYGQRAYGYYRDAERRQVFLPNLQYFLVRAAFENGSERIHHYTMAQFLRKPDGDIPLLVYVYHLLLTDPGLSDLAADRAKEILQMAAHCLQNEVRSRYANSLYYFFWLKCNEMEISGNDVAKAEEILLDDLCKFEVVDTSRTVRHLYVNEWEKRGIAEYDFPAEGILIVDAVGSGFRYTGFSRGRARVLDERLEIRRQVAMAGLALYRHFYMQGKKDFEIVAYLAKSYMQLQHRDDFRENREDADLLTEILETVMADKRSSKAFKTQCSVALGQIHYYRGHFELALEYYGKADENALDDDFLEHMLTAYVRQSAFGRAAGLVERKGHRMKDRTLFNAIRPLAAPEHSQWHSAIAKSAYQLLLRSRYDKALLEVVLANFAGTQSQWLDLGLALSAVSVHEPRLDEIILKNAVWAHHFDEGSQRVFIRMAALSSESYEKADKDFIYYAVYEMIIGKARPLPETIAILEKICLEGHGGRLLAYGLAHMYLGHGISSAHSEAIIRAALSFQEESGIFFPIFKGSKRISSTYIEKYRPFLYRALPGKDVRLYYKVAGEEEWRIQPMAYWRFGLYLTRIPHFYNETLAYYYSEELPTGSITTREDEVHNTEMHLDESQTDPFFIINNATIYEQMFRYEQVEEIIGTLVKDVRAVRSRLM